MTGSSTPADGPKEINKMMRKSLWIIALLAAAIAVPSAVAQTEDITMTAGVGYKNATGQWTKNAAGNVTSFSFNGTFSGWSFNTTSFDQYKNSTSLAQALSSGNQEWRLQGTAADGYLFIVVGSGYDVLFAGSCNLASYTSNSCGAHTDQGNAWNSVQVPEPPVYLLALLGVFFTRNRISQGIRQALRWNH